MPSKAPPPTDMSGCRKVYRRAKHGRIEQPHQPADRLAAPYCCEILCARGSSVTGAVEVFRLMNHLAMIVDHPLGIVREFDEASFECALRRSYRRASSTRPRWCAQHCDSTNVAWSFFSESLRASAAPRLQRDQSNQPNKTVRNVGRFSLDQFVSDTASINEQIKNVIDGHTEP